MKKEEVDNASDEKESLNSSEEESKPMNENIKHSDEASPLFKKSVDDSDSFCQDKNTESKTTSFLKSEDIVAQSKETSLSLKIEETSTSCIQIEQNNQVFSEERTEIIDVTMIKSKQEEKSNPDLALVTELGEEKESDKVKNETEQLSGKEATPDISKKPDTIIMDKDMNEPMKQDEQNKTEFVESKHSSEQVDKESSIIDINENSGNENVSINVDTEIKTSDNKESSIMKTVDLNSSKITTVSSDVSISTVVENKTTISRASEKDLSMCTDLEKESPDHSTVKPLESKVSSRGMSPVLIEPLEEKPKTDISTNLSERVVTPEIILTHDGNDEVLESKIDHSDLDSPQSTEMPINMTHADENQESTDGTIHDSSNINEPVEMNQANMSNKMVDVTIKTTTHTEVNTVSQIESVEREIDTNTKQDCSIINDKLEVSDEVNMGQGTDVISKPDIVTDVETKPQDHESQNDLSKTSDSEDKIYKPIGSYKEDMHVSTKYEVVSVKETNTVELINESSKEDNIEPSISKDFSLSTEKVEVLPEEKLTSNSGAGETKLEETEHVDTQEEIIKCDTVIDSKLLNVKEEQSSKSEEENNEPSSFQKEIIPDSLKETETIEKSPIVTPPRLENNGDSPLLTEDIVNSDEYHKTELAIKKLEEKASLIASQMEDMSATLDSDKVNEKIFDLVASDRTKVISSEEDDKTMEVSIKSSTSTGIESTTITEGVIENIPPISNNKEVASEKPTSLNDDISHQDKVLEDLSVTQIDLDVKNVQDGKSEKFETDDPAKDITKEEETLPEKEDKNSGDSKFMPESVSTVKTIEKAMSIVVESSQSLPNEPLTQADDMDTSSNKLIESKDSTSNLLADSQAMEEVSSIKIDENSKSQHNEGSSADQSEYISESEIKDSSEPTVISKEDQFDTHKKDEKEHQSTETIQLNEKSSKTILTESITVMKNEVVSETCKDELKLDDKNDEAIPEENIVEEVEDEKIAFNQEAHDIEASQMTEKVNETKVTTEIHQSSSIEVKKITKENTISTEQLESIEKKSSIHMSEINFTSLKFYDFVEKRFGHHDMSSDKEEVEQLAKSIISADGANISKEEAFESKENISTIKQSSFDIKCEESHIEVKDIQIVEKSSQLFDMSTTVREHTLSESCIVSEEKDNGLFVVETQEPSLVDEEKTMLSSEEKESQDDNVKGNVSKTELQFIDPKSVDDGLLRDVQVIEEEELESVSGESLVTFEIKETIISSEGEIKVSEYTTYEVLEKLDDEPLEDEDMMSIVSGIDSINASSNEPSKYYKMDEYELEVDDYVIIEQSENLMTSPLKEMEEGAHTVDNLESKTEKESKSSEGEVAEESTSLDYIPLSQKEKDSVEQKETSSQVDDDVSDLDTGDHKDIIVKKAAVKLQKTPNEKNKMAVSTYKKPHQPEKTSKIIMRSKEVSPVREPICTEKIIPILGEALVSIDPLARDKMLPKGIEAPKIPENILECETKKMREDLTSSEKSKIENEKKEFPTSPKFEMEGSMTESMLNETPSDNIMTSSMIQYHIHTDEIDNEEITLLPEITPDSEGKTLECERTAAVPQDSATLNENSLMIDSQNKKDASSPDSKDAEKSIKERIIGSDEDSSSVGNRFQATFAHTFDDEEDEKPDEIAQYYSQDGQQMNESVVVDVSMDTKSKSSSKETHEELVIYDRVIDAPIENNNKPQSPEGVGDEDLQLNEDVSSTEVHKKKVEKESSLEDDDNVDSKDSIKEIRGEESDDDEEHLVGDEGVLSSSIADPMTTSMYISSQEYQPEEEMTFDTVLTIIRRLEYILRKTELILVDESSAIICEELPDENMLKSIAISIDEIHKLVEKCQLFYKHQTTALDFKDYVHIMTQSVECLVIKSKNDAQTLINRNVSCKEKLKEDLSRANELLVQCKNIEIEDEEEELVQSEENIITKTPPPSPQVEKISPKTQEKEILSESLMESERNYSSSSFITQTTYTHEMSDRQSSGIYGFEETLTTSPITTTKQQSSQLNRSKSLLVESVAPSKGSATRSYSITSSDMSEREISSNYPRDLSPSLESTSCFMPPIEEDVECMFPTMIAHVVPSSYRRGIPRSEEMERLCDVFLHEEETQIHSDSDIKRSSLPAPKQEEETIEPPSSDSLQRSPFAPSPQSGNSSASSTPSKRKGDYRTKVVTKTVTTRTIIDSEGNVIEEVIEEVEDSTSGEAPEDPIAAWGKPLRLPSPIRPNSPPQERKSNNKKSDRAQAASPPVYMDLAYVPHHGDAQYSNAEFFMRVRARYYVFSGVEPSKDVFNALLEAKQKWEDKNLEVTIIPTYDSDALGYWVAENEETLIENKIDLAPSASRCTINLQDHETSCAAYRLEF